VKFTKQFNEEDVNVLKEWIAVTAKKGHKGPEYYELEL